MLVVLGSRQKPCGLTWAIGFEPDRPLGHLQDWPECSSGPCKGASWAGGTFPVLHGSGLPLCTRHCSGLTGSRDWLPFSLACFDWFAAPSSLSKVTSHPLHHFGYQVTKMYVFFKHVHTQRDHPRVSVSRHWGGASSRGDDGEGDEAVWQLAGEQLSLVFVSSGKILSRRTDFPVLGSSPAWCWCFPCRVSTPPLCTRYVFLCCSWCVGGRPGSGGSCSPAQARPSLRLAHRSTDWPILVCM